MINVSIHCYIPAILSSGGGNNPEDEGPEGLELPGLITAERCQSQILGIELAILLTPFGFICWLINNGAVLEASQIKHADTAIGTAADKDVHAVCTEPNIVDFLIVCNQLSFGSQGWNVPNGAGGVNARSDDQAGRNCVPVKGGDGGRMLGRFGV